MAGGRVECLLKTRLLLVRFRHKPVIPCHSTARPTELDMAAQAFSSAKDGISGDADSLAGAVLRRLVLTEADLPEGIQFLPSLFRLLAFMLFLPVSVLTAVCPVPSSRSAGRCVPYHTSSSIPTPTPPLVSGFERACQLTDCGLDLQVDLVGWIFFKAVLRPLGYASTCVLSSPSGFEAITFRS